MHVLGGVLIIVGFCGWAVTGSWAFLVMTLGGVALIVDNWIKGGSGQR